MVENIIKMVIMSTQIKMRRKCMQTNQEEEKENELTSRIRKKEKGERGREMGRRGRRRGGEDTV